MPHCPRSRKDLLEVHPDSNGWLFLWCPVCLFSEAYHQTPIGEARFLFWQEHDKLNPKETKMNTDYKRGVEDATTPLTPYERKNWTAPDGVIDPDDVGHILAKRRKTLLTKKVTKWIGVYDQNNGIGSPCYTAYVHDTKEAATKDSGYVRNVGSVPIEIEVSI